MLLVLSPAKTLDLSAPAPDAPASAPEMVEDAAKLAAIARRLKRRDLRRLMGISEALAELNVERFQALAPRRTDLGVQAALVFAGDVYRGLKARELDAGGLAWAQDHLRILSGLYGLLRPLDRIQPYRLEMGVHLPSRRGDTLYDFWGDRIAKALNRAGATHRDRTLVNLASREYFSAVDPKALKLEAVSCLFKQESASGVRTVALFAKTARGSMARYAIDHRLEHAADLQHFDRDGYRYRPELSTDRDWTFVRPHPAPPQQPLAQQPLAQQLEA